LWRNKRTQRLGEIAQRACVSHATQQSDQPKIATRTNPSAAAKEDSSVVAKQFLPAHAALEQSWCSHWKAANRKGRSSAVAKARQWLLWIQN